MPRLNFGRRTVISGPLLMRPLALSSVAVLIFALLAVTPAAAGVPTIIVDRTDDTAAASACTAAVNDCSLRGASIFTNAHAGTTISLPAGTYQLTIAGNSGSPVETDGNCGNATKGDLDFTANNTTLTGAGAATTTIQQTTADRVMCLNPALTFNWNFTMSGVTITGGNNTDVNGAAGLLGGGRNNTTNLSNCVFTGNTSTGGQYGGAIGNFGGDLTVTNCTFTNNTSNNSGGGAISYTSGDPGGNAGGTLPGASGTLTVTNSTFTNNTAKGSGGGAIDIYQVNLSTTNASITGSTFTSNKAPNGGGGAIEIETGNTISITKSTFTSNTAHQTGGAISNGGVGTSASQDTFVSNSLTNPTAGGGGGAIGQSQGAMTVHYSRFSGNTNASPGLANTLQVISGTFDANDNWWGLNTGPGASGDVVGTTPTTWLQLRHTSNVSNVLLGGVASLSADILGRNSGGPISSTNLVGLAAFPASGVFGNSIKGALSGASTQFVTGQASATWTAGVTSAACGAGGADAVADSQTVTAHIQVRCPDLTATKSNDKSGAVVVGESWTWTVTIANGGDADGTFSAGQVVLFDQLPNSAAVSYGSPSSSNVNVTCAIDGSQNLTCSVPASHTLTMAPAASFTVTVTTTASAATTYANPRASSTCAVDSDLHVVESNEGNNSCSNSVTVNKAATSTSISSDLPDPSIVGNAVPVNFGVLVTLPGHGTPTGNVTVTDGVSSCTDTVAAGTCTITLTTLGIRSLVATYAGDDNFLGSVSSPGTPHEVDGPPSISSADHATFTAGTAGTFSVTTIAGYPTATTLGRSGSLPSGVTFTDNGNGTATLAGTPGGGTHGTYPLTITASNGINPDATQSFTLTVNEPPTITSLNSTTFTVGTAGTFSVTTTAGTPSTTTLSKTGALPSGVSFTDNGDGTATLAGTPASGTGGTYGLTIKASNGVNPDATQSFTLTINEPPSISSADHATFTVGSAGTFTVTTAAGHPTATTLSKTGALPSGVSFTDNGNGTATLSGTPGAATHGTYPLTITASNGINPDSTQSFTLTVNEPPAITSADHVTCHVGTSCTFTVTTAAGLPAPTTISLGGDTLPTSLTFVDNLNGTATLSGTPDAGTAGTYNLTFTASNGVNPDDVQGFTLTVDKVIVVLPPPTPGAPIESLRSGAGQNDHRLPGRLDWASGVTTSSITTARLGWTYELQVRTQRPGAAWSSWTSLQSDITATHVKRSFFINVWYQFRVRAVGSGVPSAWATGSQFLPQMVDDGSASVTYVGTWSVTHSASAFGGTRHTTTHVGDSAQVTLTGTVVAVVMPTGPGYGIARICVDEGQPGEVCRSVNLASWPTTAKRVVFTVARLHEATHVLGITLTSTGVIGLAIDVNALIR
jgi:Bacterial Ig-like domain (group 3)/Putative Ig domain/CARDB